MRNSTLNWETPGDFDRLGYLNDALEETYKDVRYHHEEEKIRYRKHRKAAFKKGSRRRVNASICMAGALTAAISSP